MLDEEEDGEGRWKAQGGQLRGVNSCTVVITIASI